MRIEGISKLGYYPTPDTQLPLILSWLRRSASAGEYRLLDPCAGKGEALACLAHGLGKTTTFGIELSYTRAEEAGKNLDHVLSAGFENTVLTNETFSFCLLNPPYDGEKSTGGGERLEGRFLLSTTPLLAPGGVLVYVIPEARVDEKIAKHLAGWYADLCCFRFTEPDYQVFKQVVIFGQKKEYRQPTQEAVDAVLAWADGKLITGYEERLVEVETGREEALPLLPDEGQTEKRKKKIQVPAYAVLPPLSSGNGEYVLPPSPPAGPRGQAFRFKQIPVTEDDYLRAADLAAQALEKSRAWLSLVPEVEAQTITPAITPKQGHISMLVTAGLLGTTLVDHNGQRLLLKGGTEKYTVRVDEDNEEEEIEFDPDDPDKKKRLFRVKVEERSRPTLFTLDSQGSFQFSNDPNHISDVLRVHVTELAQRVIGRNVPRYDMKPETWEWQAFEGLSRERYLPGRRETGLTDFQKHLAVALGRLLWGTRSGLINAEMGSGKSTISLAVAEYLTKAYAHNRSEKTAYPILVVGPGIVTGDQNWPKETREVIPGAVSRVIETAARPVPKPAKVIDWLKEQNIHITDEGAFEGLSARQAWREIVEAAHKQGRWLEKGGQDRQVRLALWSTLRQGEKNPPRKRQEAEKPNLLDTRIGGYAWLGLGELARDKAHAAEMHRRYSLAQFVEEYRQGKLPQKSVAILSYETAKLGSGRVPAMPTRKLRIHWKEEGEIRQKIIDACTCPRCGRVVADEYDEGGAAVTWKIVTPARAGQFVGARRRYCQAPMPRWVWNPETGQHEVRETDDDGRPLVCGAPLFSYTEVRREAAARFVQRKARNFFPLLLVDEIHEAKAKVTGNGWALTVLAGSSPYTLGLTGTLFGGFSTTIFWLMYRLSALVRRDFGFHDEMDWARRFGLMRYTFYVSRPEDVMEDGSYTGQKFMSRVDERPGILPSIIRLGLPKICFASLQDIGLPLPAYNEEVVWLPLSNGMADQYHDQADGSLVGKPYPPESMYEWAIEELKDGTKGALSVWLTTALNRVNSMFREEEVWFNRRVAGKGKYATRKPELVTTLPELAEAQVSPKDRWLASRCQAERDEGRKSLVFIRQTGKRDIQPHVAGILQEQGLRVGVLSPAIEPRRRVTWIEKHASQIDVLLTNARLVKVGLNLRMFATAIFFEMEWSLPVVWQAMRRVYRPGAPLPVRILFPAYENTLEERALNLMGQKMRAAQLFYGDTVASALCDEEENDFLNDLILSVLKDERLERATNIFATQNDMTASPLGSPTAASPHLVTLDAYTWAEWLALQQKSVVRSGALTRSSRRKIETPKEQIRLFG